MVVASEARELARALGHLAYKGAPRVCGHVCERDACHVRAPCLLNVDQQTPRSRVMRFGARIQRVPV